MDDEDMDEQFQMILQEERYDSFDFSDKARYDFEKKQVQEQIDLQKALNIAIKAHKGQVDKAGVDYINHPVYLALQMNTAQEKMVALLHDVLEDSDLYTYEDLCNIFGYEEEIADSVLVLTHKKSETYFDYIRYIKVYGNIPLKVKIADLKHNMDLSRLPNVTDKDLSRMKRYEKALKILTSKGEQNNG